ncbi:MAG: DUF4935 domain-containing protein [Oscillospiraceae bacterium]|nr:DUF4935 domain-containing protein [Oscillospiraceae bacterium]
MKEAVCTIHKNIRNSNRLIADPISINDISIEKEVQKYRDFLEIFSIQNGMVTAEEYPNVSHKEIVIRALRRKKPFKQDGSTGYRDYLVWRTCLHLACTYVSEEIHFITQNVNDFSDTNDKKKLHDDFLDELNEMNIDNTRFYYWTSIKEFVDKHIQPRIEVMDNKERMRSLIESGEDYSSRIKEFIDRSIVGTDLSCYDVIVPGQSVLLKEIEEIWDENIEEISTLQDSELLLEITVCSVCIVEATMFLEEYNEIKDWEDIYEMKIIEQNLCCVQLIKELNVHLNVKYNNETNSIESIQLDYIDENNCDFCF